MKNKLPKITIADIAHVSGVGTATIGRYMNKRGNIKIETIEKIEQAIAELQRTMLQVNNLTFAVFIESSADFVPVLKKNFELFFKNNNKYNLILKTVVSTRLNETQFSEDIIKGAEKSDAVILIMRQAKIFSNTISHITEQLNKPVACFSTDQPKTSRNFYIGIDNFNAGSCAANLMGQMLHKQTGKILLIIGKNYHSGLERELGFRMVLRNDYPNLQILENINANDDKLSAYKTVSNFLAANKSDILGIYNIAGGIEGVYQAIEEHDLQDLILIGHELMPITKKLLEERKMNFAIGYDIYQGIEKCVAKLEEITQLNQNSHKSETIHLPINIYNMYSIM